MAFGRIALCGDCDRRRSAVGKGIAPRRFPDPGTLVEVIVARDACCLAQARLNQAVSSARSAGQAWSSLGTILGISRQAAQQRFGATPNS